jgi:hypothetical protein
MSSFMRAQISSINPYSGLEVNPNAPGRFGYGTNFAPGIDANSAIPSRRSARSTELTNNVSSNVDMGDSPITYPYNTPEWTYASDSNLRAQQIIFAVRERDLDERGGTCVLSLAAINTLAAEQWQQFVISTTGNSTTNSYFNQDAMDFLGWLQEYGERTLWYYEWLRRMAGRSSCKTSQYLKDLQGLETAKPEVKQMWERAQTPQYCYLTSFGFIKRLNYLGILEHRSNSGVTEDNCADGGEQVSLAISLAKRTRVANAFGTADEVVVGGNTWITLTRRPCPGPGGRIPYGSFVLIPGASRDQEFPLLSQRRYLDESGAMCRGYLWRVGRVLEIDNKHAQRSQLEAASNLPGNLSSRVSSDVHEGLPRVYLALGL